MRCSGIEGVEGPAARRWWVRMLPSGDARIDGKDVIRFGFAIEQVLHLLEFGCIRCCKILRLGVVLRQMVELPWKGTRVFLERIGPGEQAGSLGGDPAVV